MLHKFYRFGLFGLLFGGLLVMSGCGRTASSAASTSQQPIRVVTSLDFYGEVARAVLGQHGHVTTLIHNPSIDPHDFTPTPLDATAVTHANFVIGNGLGYDGWLDKLVHSTHTPPTFLRVGNDVLHLQNGDNPHVWYRPTTMAQLATTLAKRFSQQAPRYRQAYHRNAQAYIASLQPITHKIDQLKQRSAHQTVAVSEPVFDYALDALGYHRGNSSFERAVENGTDPSPQAIRQLQTSIRQRRIAFFVNNSQASSKTVAAMVKLAHQSHVPVLNVTETLPHGKTYRTWMLGQYQQLAKFYKLE
ncbi:metal ABC transporter solute-binding protein, Zn/Mn family [Levilactobacillus acidifarinae]|uniref:ABC-type metal ion transport system, periplasmic component surface adhesin n=1 Tax=Levilactobacillus acidifarinae DSM 19394 = JCM 15949 TaxID=1423715 RepID=A0A0R1LTH4_9LACO|nr:zinc ABC transporter substrate-binding protein [Levilactobacillus acidifarinae]KRK96500.1 ABC-type metal ion transport system, periplasmic component surface adhesin [Levilactobacillus acidifarinae DSM 19394]GEO68914.1 metal ABC transporter substrate-binding protein [Levilactobacillus acidifarinae]